MMEKYGYKMELEPAYKETYYVRIYDINIKKGVDFLSTINPDDFIFNEKIVIKNVIEKYALVDRKKIPKEKLEKLIKIAIKEIKKKEKKIKEE